MSVCQHTVVPPNLKSFDGRRRPSRSKSLESHILAEALRPHICQSCYTSSQAQVKGFRSSYVIFNYCKRNSSIKKLRLERNSRVRSHNSMFSFSDGAWHVYKVLQTKPSRSQICRSRERGSCMPLPRGQKQFRFTINRHRMPAIRARGDFSEDQGYWDSTEGKEKLEEIQDLGELVAQAEKLQENSSSDTEGDDAQSRAAKERERLAKLAMEQAKQKKEAEIMLKMGQNAYGRGSYDNCVEIFEAASTKVSGSSNLGGEIQLWLAMAYEANGRHEDCISLYKRLEGSHPNKIIRRQAADLRYILEAPKLKISKDEMVQIPVIEKDYDRKAKSWSQTIKDSKKKPSKRSSQSRDYLEDWLVWKPPRWERNPYFWVAVTIWLTLVGISLIYQNWDYFLKFLCCCFLVALILY